MKVKATTNFAGEICMATGEVRDVPESVAEPLLKCGYLEAVETPAETPDQEPDPAEPDPTETPDQEPEQATEETTEETPDQEPEKPKRSRAKTKTEG